MKVMHKKVLVTGSGGFIFSNFIRKALYQKSDYSFVSIDACRSPKVTQNIYVNKGHTFYIGDVSDRHFVNVIFEVERPDIVIHAAAETFVDDAIQNADAFVKSNVLGTQVIIDACLKWDVGRLIYISTDEVYGQLDNEQTPSWKEDAPFAPRNPYSASKAAGELFVRAAHQTHGLEYNITRSANNYGPRQSLRNFIPKIIHNVLQEQPVPVFGQGRQMREWLHVEDNCAAVMAILQEGKPNETYNISSSDEFSNLEVFHEVCNVLGKGHELLTFVEDRKGHDFRYSVDSTKIRSLGWKPTFRLKRGGLAHTCNWYVKNPWFWRGK